MAIKAIPASAGGGIKSVQRGLASAAGSVTITAVDTSKAFVQVYGTTSAGTIATDSTVDATNASACSGLSGSNISAQFANTGANIASRNISAGTNNLVAAVAQGYLSNSTTLVVSHACRWEVIEFA
jgi:hypothetical protein